MDMVNLNIRGTGGILVYVNMSTGKKLHPQPNCTMHYPHTFSPLCFDLQRNKTKPLILLLVHI